ncbi:gamma-glutamylcyclotransferase family protein [Sandarakinorhabdus rubra]|uniref:gamma-glutamylcyclotransferase family protein n=1 Tax=Sandarakinorhabdus rubra TaxID=2672568 RepID=UPI0013DBBB46|nr:gamma-glutamylcyclotransferase [Sandarakinorhabdus rubra]
MSQATTVLAVYGTLAPGRANHHELAGLAGVWSHGWVRGLLLPQGWGAALGSPGLLLDDDGANVPVHLFHSGDLPAHWARLDEFEGPGYCRTLVMVSTPAGNVPAFIYALAMDGMPPDHE